MTATDGLCPDCGLPLFDHLTADECEAHGIDAGLRDGLGCAVVVRPFYPDRSPLRRKPSGPGDEAAIARESIANLAHPSDCSICWVDFVSGSRSDHAYAPALRLDGGAS